MTSDKTQSQRLSLLFCKMGHTPHHKALKSQLLILLCIGTDPSSFFDTLASEFWKWVAINSGAYPVYLFPSFAQAHEPGHVTLEGL